MRTRSRYLLVLAVAAGLILPACSNGTEENAPVPPPSQAEGLITEMRPAEGEPDSFLLETEEHGTFEVFIADEIDYGFDLQHLHEHLTEELPVRVQLEVRADKAYASEIEDI